ncbi:eCIS core domain-containing protein [Microscilla marina]|uniref:NAD(+)--protein-arginine ADP-ribosyltransferase n=1 Tax=Microscilla marina ATCC 23134 TaxID=313606 RepID=A1ZFS4_MICM2|nr:DUF4157 domain-containing protein [Microscilla marina]EAY30848.1 hypothetical protein M23134_01172 [Microscilla marina ATCC 23134]
MHKNQSNEAQEQSTPPQIVQQKKAPGAKQTKESGKLPIQAKQQVVQRKDKTPPPIQAKQRPVQRQTGGVNEAQVKANVSSLTGTDVSDAQVHYNSSLPTQMKAEATAQGNQVHLAPGKERHLGHELTHVAQQKQGRVQPTIQANNGVGINNDPKLEKEADDVGAKAMQMKSNVDAPVQRASGGNSSESPMQFNLGAYAMSGQGSGMLGNLFGTSTFQEISTKLGAYQASANQSEKDQLLKQIKQLSEKWLKDNQKAHSANANTKRDSIRGLLALVNEEMASRNDDAKYFKEAKKFEHNLGLYLFNHGGAQAAVTTALNKMSEVMGVEADNSLAGNIFGGNNAKYAGNVGNDVNRVMEVVNQGNLREKLTAFYNASLGPFKNMVTEHIKLTGSMDGQNWQQARQSLGNKGIADEGIDNIEARKNQIEDYPNQLGWGALGLLGHQEKMQDLYTAAADPYVRGKDDALKKGQKGIFEKEGRAEAFDLGTFSPEAFNFNFDQFGFRPEDLQGDPNGMLGNALNTSTFAKIQTALAGFTNAVNSNDKLRNYKTMKNLSWKWLKDHQGQEEVDVQTKRQSIEALQRELNKVYSGSTRKASDLTNAKGFSAELSDREKLFIQEQNPSYEKDTMFGGYFSRLMGIDTYEQDKELPWEEGGTRFNPNLKNSWMKKAVKELKMPVVAGPSGTTDRMLTALNFLGLSAQAENFRLGLLGWMLTSNDHSFHEIMSVSKSFGLEYEEGPYAYHKISPLTIQQIRANVCENGMFPDEIVYDGHRADFALVQNELIDPWTAYGTLAPDLQQRLSPAAAAAIRLYTGGGYLVQNPAKESGDLVAKQKIKHQVENKPELLHLKNDYEAGNVSLSELLKEGKTHNAMLYNALRDLPDHVGSVYRGQGSLPWDTFTVGQTKTLHKFTSTTKTLDRTYPFMQTGRITTPVLIEMQVNTGKDVSSISRYQAEEEVLLQPGTTFTVTAVTPGVNDNRDNVPNDKRPYTRVVMTQN